MKRFLIPLSGDNVKRPKTLHGHEEGSNEAGVSASEAVCSFYLDVMPWEITVRSTKLSFVSSSVQNHSSSCLGMQMA
jgi:hypothetical protein